MQIFNFYAIEFFFKIGVYSLKVEENVNFLVYLKQISVVKSVKYLYFLAN
jgi:hypothetical protein